MNFSKLQFKTKSILALALGVIFALTAAVALVPAEANAAVNWVANPASCPQSDPANFPGQNCAPNNMCGDSSGIAQCYNTGSIPAPAVNANSSVLHASALGGGYVINCFAVSDAGIPYCDNNGAAWCNRSASCFGGGNNRLTTCLAGTWSYEGASSFTCGDCLTTHLDCAGDTRCEVQKNVTAYPTGGNNHYGATCNPADVRCNTNYYDCDATGVTVGNGCEAYRAGACTAPGGVTGSWSCSVDAGGTCTNGAQNYTCTCVAPKCQFESATLCQYFSADPLLWGKQLGSGELIRMGNTVKEDAFVVNNDGSIRMATTSAPGDTTNSLYNVGGDLYWDGTLIGAGASSSALDFQQVTDLGNITTNWIQFAGGTSTSDFSITGNLNVTGDALFVNATGTNIAVAEQFMLGQYAVLPATGYQSGAMVYNTTESVPYFWDGSSWVAFATGTGSGSGDLQAVTDLGNITTNWIEFAGGTSTNVFTIRNNGGDSSLIIDGDDGSGNGYSANIYLNGDSAGGGESAIRFAANGSTYGLIDGGPDNFRVISGVGVDAMQFGTQAFSAFFKNNTGRLGLGVYNPESTLHVYDRFGTSTGSVLTLENTVGRSNTFITDNDPNGLVTGSRGDLAMDSTNGRLYIKEIGTGTNTGWVAFATGTSSVSLGWLLSGNSGTNSLTDYIGTTDAQPLVFRTNDTEAMRLDINGRLGVGTNSPSSLLHIQGGQNGPALLVVDSVDGNGFGNDAGIIINADNNNGSDAAYLIFQNNGVQSAKFLGATSGSGFDLAAGTTFGITQGGFVRLHMTDMGNFGFATDTPMYRVDVLGDARVSAQLMLGQYAVNPANGHQAGSMIYNSAQSIPYFWNGLSWVAFATGTGAGAGDLQAVTDLGNITTNSIQFAGGTSTGDFYASGKVTVGDNDARATGNLNILSTHDYAHLNIDANGGVDSWGSAYITLNGGSDGGEAGVQFQNNGTTYGLLYATPSTYLMQSRLGADIRITSYSSSDLFISNANGRVGIGSTVPLSSLHVASFNVATTPVLTLENLVNTVQTFVVEANPEGSITASIGDMAIDGTNGRLYIKETGNLTNTGWVAFATGTGSGAGDLQAVTDVGSLTTNWIEFAGGTSTGNFLVNRPSASAYLTVRSGNSDAYLDLIGSGGASALRMSSNGGGNYATFEIASNGSFNMVADGTGTIWADAPTGNVGIGHSSPTDLLHVYSDTRTSALRVSSGDGQNAYVIVDYDRAMGGEGSLSFRENGVQRGVINSGWNGYDFFAIAADNGYALDLLTTGVPRVHITNSTGRVGIGTITPSTRLHVNSGAASTTAIATYQNNAGDYQQFLVTGNPQGLVTGSRGDLAIDSANGRLYIKETGNGTNTGWVAFATGTGAGAEDLQTVTDAGNITTNWIEFAGGTSTGDIVFANGDDRLLGVQRAADWTDGYDLLLSAGHAGLLSMAGNSGGNVVINGGLGSGFPTIQGNVFLASERGRVGIGSYNANSMLHIQGGERGHAVVTIDSNDGMGNGADAGIIINSDYANGSDAAYVSFRNNGTENGKIFGSSLGSGFITVGNNPFVFTNNGLTTLHIEGDGNIGINTTAPAYRLDVVGDARLSAQLLLGRYAVNPVSGHQAGAMVYNTAQSVPYFWDGTTWVAFATGTGAGASDLQSVTDIGNITTNWIEFAGGTSTNDFAIIRPNAETHLSVISGDSDSILILEGNAGATELRMSSDGGATLASISTGISGSFSFTVNGFLPAYMDGVNGYFGVNTSNPMTQLHVNASSASTTAIATYQNNAGDYQQFLVTANPQGLVAGSRGDLAIDSANGRLYIKETGDATNTGWVALVGGSSYASAIWDTDKDTGIQVEKNPDEDIIRFQTAGTEYFTMDGPRLNVINSGMSTFFGDRAGRLDNLIGTGNVYMGYQAGFNNVNGTRNVILGSQAGYNLNGGGQNILMGYQAGYTLTNQGNNVAIGHEAGRNSIGSSNNLLGYRAGLNDSGFTNNIIGYRAGENNTGNYNSIIGLQAGISNTGEQNIIIGDYSGQFNSGAGNVIIGNVAGVNNAGTNNFILGSMAGNDNTGDNNIFLGTRSGTNNLSGSNNIFIGFRAGSGNTTGYNNIFLGNYTAQSINANNKLYIDIASTTHPLVYGDFMSDILRINGTLEVGDPALSGYRLPVARGSNAQILITDGLGNVSWGTSTGSGGDDLQGVTDLGNITTNWIQFAGATSTGNIIPGTHNTYSLGSTARRWSDVWASNVHIGTSTWDLAQAANGALTVTRAGGSEAMRILTNGNVGIGTSNPDRIFHAEINDNVTNAITYAARFSHSTAGLATSHFGTGLEFELQNNAGINKIAGTLDSRWNNASNNVESSEMMFRTVVNGALDERMRIDANGNVSVGFGGTTVGYRFRVDGNSLFDVGGELNSVVVRNMTFTIPENQLRVDSLNHNVLLQEKSGNVGIGEAIPSHKLHVNGGVAGNNLFHVEAGSNGGHISMYVSSTDDRNSVIGFQRNMEFFSQDQMVMTLTNSRRVGVGITSPAYRLDIVGDARLSAQFMLGQYALNPASGLQAGAMIYNTASSTPFFWNGTSWKALASQDLITLDRAYDAGGSGVGRQIRVDSGAVWLTDAGNGTALQVDYTGSGDAIAVTNNSTGKGFVVAQTGSGVGMYVRQNNGTGLVVENNTGNYGIYVDANSTGDAMRLNNYGNGANALYIDNSTNGYGINIDHWSGVAGIAIRTDATSDGNLIDLTNQSSGAGVLIANSGAGYGIQIPQTGTGQGIYIRQHGGIGMQLDNNTANNGFVLANGSTGNGMIVRNSGTSGNGIFIDNDTDGAGIYIDDTLGKASINISKPSGSGDLMHLSNAGTGDVFDISNTSSGVAFRLANTGSGHSLYITDEASDSSPFVLTANGDLGIGTASPDARLKITGNNSLADVTLLKFESASNSDIQSEIYFSGGGNATNWNVNSSGNGGALIIRDGTSEVGKFLNNGFIINDGGATNIDFRVESASNTHAVFADATNGYVGFDQSVPLAKLHVGNTTAGSASDYEYMRLQGNGDVDHRLYKVSGSNFLVWDYNVIGNGGAIEFRNGASRVGLFTNSGLVINEGGVAGVGLRVEGDIDPALLFTDATNDRVGIGTNSPATKLYVKEIGATVAAFDRTNNDGVVISIRQEGVEEGTISVSGTTVSYNAFTGSHYAWIDEQIERGMLVSLTGDNRNLHNNPQSEIVYGVAKTAIANDSKVMGSYLALQESNKAYDESNPHLIMAVGNGEMWVDDKGENINIGDYLISSDVVGHAQKDTGEFIVSHIVAKAAESVNWSNVTSEIDGVKHKKISVFFESFDKSNMQSSVAGTSLQGGDSNLEVVDLAVGSAVFEGDVTVMGHVMLSRDSVGQAMILTGENIVSVTFEMPYDELPIVTVTPYGAKRMDYGVENVSLTGFDIVIDPIQYQDIIFNWHAFGNREAKVFVSNGTTLDIEMTEMGSSKLESDINSNGQIVVSEPVEDEPVTTEPTTSTEPTSEPAIEPEPEQTTETSTEPEPAPATEPEPEQTTETVTETVE